MHTSLHLRKSNRIRSQNEDKGNEQQPEKRTNEVKGQLQNKRKKEFEKKELRINLIKTKKQFDGVNVYI